MPRAMNVTSAPAFASATPNAPPTPPAPTTAIRIHVSPDLRPSDHDIADLDNRRQIGVVRNISHDLLGMRAKAGLERFDRVTKDMTHGDIGRRRSRRSAGNALVDCIELAGVT